MRAERLSATLQGQLQTTLGEAFVVEGELGRGGMSRLFVAVDVALDRRIAVKVLRPDLGAGVNIERFRREIAITASLQHPHIVPVFAAGETAGLPYYTMPLVDGESLAEWLEREGPPPVDEAVAILRDVARALAYAHGRGVIHRDVKPQNVLLAGKSATVTDFGIAKAVASARDEPGTEITTQGLAIGTPAYMAPEQAGGDEPVDQRADLYSFGCLAYELLVGEPPFRRPTARAMVAAHLIEEPVPVGDRRKGLPPQIADIVMRCLAKDPAQRPASAEEILRALSGAVPTGQQTEVEVVGAVPSVAVLPFTNMSVDPGNEFFSDGVTEEILNSLARVRSLRVAARTSSFAFKGQQVDVQEIGRRLGVDTVLEGSVRRAGNRVRIAARLVNAKDGYQIWGDDYDRELEDVFVIQDEIASSIAGALTSALADWLHPASTGPRRKTTSVAAYELYLKGRYFLNQRVDGMWKAMEYYRRALEKDPGFALAHSGVAEAHFLLALYAAVPPGEGGPQARDAARRALALDPTLAEPHTVLANLSLWYDWDPEATLVELNRAVELKPSDPLAQSCYGYYFGALGLFDEAISRVRAAVEIDPLSMWANSNLAVTSYLARRFDETIAHCRTMIELSPGYSEAHRWMALAQVQQGRFEVGFEAVQTAVQLSNRHFWPLANLGGMLGRAGQREEARAILAELEESAKAEYVPPLAIATVHYGLGDLDATFDWLERSVEARDFWLLMLPHDPGFDFLRKDPRFARIVERIGPA